MHLRYARRGFSQLTFSRQRFRSLSFLFLLCLCLGSPSHSSAQQPVAIIKDKYLVPESITYDDKKKEFLVSSIYRHKIVAVKEGGESRDFIQSGQDGFLGGLGLHIDHARGILWALSNLKNDGVQQSGIWTYDLATGRLLKKWVWQDTSAHLLNDLVITRKGSVYITDSEGGHVYYLEMDMKQPRIFLTMSKDDYLNGITLSNEAEGSDRYLFIATYQRGIACYDLTTSQQWIVQPPAGDSTGAMDGLFYYKNSLIGVDNGSMQAADHKIVRLYLSEDRKHILRSSVIDRQNPYFQIPTSAVIHGDMLYVLANSQLDNLDDKTHAIRDEHTLKEIYILRYKL